MPTNVAFMNLLFVNNKIFVSKNRERDSFFLSKNCYQKKNSILIIKLTF